MRGKIIIDGIAYYHPKKKVTNDFFFQHFNKQGKECYSAYKILEQNE